MGTHRTKNRKLRSWIVSTVCRRQCFIFVLVIASIASAYPVGHVGLRQDAPGEENVLWVDPGDASTFDFKYGPGGSDRQPQPPFRFVNEDTSGTSPKVNVTDGAGKSWNVKWGSEARPSAFCTRILWACGYYVAPEYFVPKGRIDGAHGLTRTESRVSKSGEFLNARFQLRTDSATFLKGRTWTWKENPFASSRELQGLKILLLLLSNWDAKTSNLAVFEDTSGGAHRYLYSDADWGASMGKWGNRLTWSKWDCEGFSSQTKDFLKRTKNGSLDWGYKGKNREDLTDVTVEDIQWLLPYLGAITDAQIHTGLQASGASPQEEDCFAVALRQRIDQLRAATTEEDATISGNSRD